MRKSLSFLSLILSWAVIHFDCNKPPVIPGTPVVYCAGVKLAAYDFADALLWKNNTATRLNTRNSANAVSVFVSGKDVFVSGNELSNNGIAMAKLWKNGIPAILSDGTRNSLATSVFVSGKDVYACISDERNIRYYKNGIIKQVDSGNTLIWGSCISASGSTVYIVGYKVDNKGFSTATLWKNGIAISLGNPAESTMASGIFVSGNDVYVVGTEYKDYYKNAYGKGIARLWKNGVNVPLLINSDATYASSVFVESGDVYVAGGVTAPNGNFIATLWKNGVPVALSDGTFNEGTTGLYVYGKDVYVSGWDNRPLNDSVITSNAKYWKNGKAIFPEGFNGESIAYSIFVK